MVVCRKRGFLFLSFDKKAVSIAKEFGINVITAGAIFHGLLIKGIASKKEVLNILQDIETSDNRLLEMEL